MIKKYLIVSLLLICSWTMFSNSPIIVKAREDSREWSLGNFIISATNGVSEVAYYLTEETIDVRYRNCRDLSEKDLESYHRAIVGELVSRYNLLDFKRILWPSFSRNGFYSISTRIAQLSSKSELYLDYRMNYPHSTLKSLNGHFVELCNKGDVYIVLKGLFKEFGVDINMISCEKVFTGKVSDLQFKDTLLKAGLNESDRVIFDAGVIVFNISPSQS